ncbi:hypothetical protein JCM19301_395 [Jejuia pallidilutea]|uniref:Uncharacterized protein n=1 Tax=Jejuia pallidilutea TaxID=504487 RepID=A0A090X103_9FLAO|nr:hypothetical protein JCM19301_395 [Jejuia pallidilutea]GAL73402.1 hypothetical protein JCM19302_1242 [Jejuia pallidilutea]GAL89696.1 hypothetical protein JCM19538_748 [Jejuia pallidilutea]
MPTLKAIHICNSHKPTLQPKIAKEYVFANADGLKNKKYDRTTMCISNSGLSAILKRKTINQRSVLSETLVV